jgi:type I restriction enzyme S subunit
MSRTLPKGWVNATLKDIVLHKKGKKPKETVLENKNGYLPYILIDEMEGKKVRAYTKDKNVPVANKNDVLIVWDGSIGKTATGIKGTIGSTIAALTPIIVEANFLNAFLQLSKPVIEQTSRGTGLQHINPRAFWPLQFPLPPINEQKCIAAKLEKIMPRIDALKERLGRIPQIIKRFRQAVLTAAVTGKLTEEWRKKHKLNIKWEYTIFEKIIIEGPQNGLYKPQKSYGSGYLIVRIDNFYDGVINPWNTVKRIELNKNELKTYGLQNGNIIINRVNSMTYLGKSALVRNLPEECVFESNMMRIKINFERGDPEYLIKYLNSQRGLNELRKNAKHAVNQSSINQQDVKAVTISLPPLKEQKEIIRQINKLFAFADKLEAHYNKAKEKIDKLPQSVLAKTFRGELVPQDPNDEPASKLLKRIIVEKEKRRAEIKKTKKQNVKSTAQKKGK